LVEKQRIHDELEADNTKGRLAAQKKIGRAQKTLDKAQKGKTRAIEKITQSIEKTRADGQKQVEAVGETSGRGSFPWKPMLGIVFGLVLIVVGLVLKAKASSVSAKVSGPLAKGPSPRASTRRTTVHEPGFSPDMSVTPTVEPMDDEDTNP